MTWTMVYAHDKDGRPTAGKLDDLINAIQAGCPVRYGIDYANHGPEVFKSAQLVCVRNGQVYAQSTGSVSCCFEPSYVNGDTATVAPGYEPQGLRFLDDAYHYFEIVSTRGDCDMSRWNIGEHHCRRRDQDKFGVRWFVQR